VNYSSGRALAEEEKALTQTQYHQKRKKEK
jgi:hypothetical protein